MSKIWVTMVDRSSKGVLGAGLAQQRMMLTDPSSVFCVWLRICLPPLLSSFPHDWVGNSKFGIQDENDCDNYSAPEGSSIS